MESFWGSMQIELLNRQKWRTKLELGIAIAEYVDHFYNAERRHSALGYLTPNEFRRSTLAKTAGQIVLSRSPLNGVNPSKWR